MGRELCLTSSRLLLPVRLPVAAAITPSVYRLLTGRDRPPEKKD